ncbi:His Kinase A (phospho-acceptor) domain-containing protein [Roseateles sp. YR242]|uniref:ATP-binding protein n=1 Tax=Roseateles sp. YR242 TaxID=1855305 RepID=UPI0008ACB911|nr:ATP-binding protein [Roseateles sp. YR242]SEL42871.1 His Kinase A (phospho-acceptor) domain-containing protein [Roseateles sp. YR242]
MTDNASARPGLRQWVNRILGDTLARRIFLLLWITLVAAQVLAIMTVQWVEGWNMPLAHVPVAPTLPPMGQMGPGPQGPMRDGGPGPFFQGQRPGAANGGLNGNRASDGSSAPFEANRPDGPPDFRSQDFHDVPIPGAGPDFTDRGPRFQERSNFRGLSNKALLLDYGIRLLVTALAAWLASRWLAKPMRQLVHASRKLGDSLHGHERLPLLDEHSGTLEVRETAQVFNAMARQLRRQFNERGLMVAAISHDLRTPLTRLRMRLETLDIEDQQRVRSVEDILEMNALIDAVMELFRGDSPGVVEDAQDVDIGALAQSMVDDLAEQGQTVSVDIQGEAVLARGQPMALRRVLGNLIGNALRYGGRADVHVGRDDRGAWIHVCDNGPGIPPDKIEAVFEPFYRLEESRNRHTGGAGLGLYIARELTRRQGGELALTNRPAGGLMAELRLP